VTSFPIGRAPDPPHAHTHPRVDAADPQNDAVFATRAALRRALTMRAAADAQCDLLRGLLDRLEAERRDTP
jgi:hypothetical protein